MLAMNYMYEGQRDFGLELLRRCQQNIVCQCGYTWDAPNIMRADADTVETDAGNDYYQNMMLWSVPAAIGGEPVNHPAQPGGLVHTMRQASKTQ